MKPGIKNYNTVAIVHIFEVCLETSVKHIFLLVKVKNDRNKIDFFVFYKNVKNHLAWCVASTGHVSS